MKIWRTIGNFIYLTINVFLITITIVIIVFNLQMKRQCTTIAEIANNEKIIEYLNNWAKETLIDKGYSYAWGMDGRITAKKDGEFVEISPLPNSDITGIESDYLRFTAHINSNDPEATITKDNISQLEFGRGRDQVIILKNSQKLNSHNGYTMDSGHLMKVNENVYAYCDHSKF